MYDGLFVLPEFIDWLEAASTILVGEKTEYFVVIFAL